MKNEFMKDELLKIGEQLFEAYIDKAEATIQLGMYTKALEARKVVLLPEGGWQGKNQSERDAARDRVYAEDTILINLSTRLQSVEDGLVRLQAKIDAESALRRSYEWVIRLMDAENAVDKVP